CRPRRAAVREGDRRRGRQPGQGPHAAAGTARQAGPRGAFRASERGGPRVRHAAGAFRARGRCRRAAARPARGVGLRIRVPDGKHEPPPDPGGRDPVPDPGRAVQLHFLVAGARDRPPGRRRVGVRDPGGGRGPEGGAAGAGFQVIFSNEREGFLMNKTMRALLLASLAASPLLLAGCGKEQPVANEASEVRKLAAPAKDDDAAWKAYLPAVVQENMGNITNNPFLYYLPPESDPEFEAKYERQVEAATTAMKRGVQKGNLLAFGSPASSRMAGLIETAFETVPDGSLKDVRIVFIGDAADNARVMTVVKPTGA